MAMATGFHLLSAVGGVCKHKQSLGVTLPSTRRFSASVTAFSSDQHQWSGGLEQPFAKSFWDYLEVAKDFIRPEDDNSPSRWFSPLDSKTKSEARCDGAPLLLFLPGIDGSGLGLVRQHQKLGQMFDIWCLHIPATNRTAFTDLVAMVERTVKSEFQRSPGKPIYLVGESLGACIALAVAACNPEIDLILILSNPATSFGNSSLQHLAPLINVLPHQLDLAFLSVLSLIPGDFRRWKQLQTFFKIW